MMVNKISKNKPITNFMVLIVDDDEFTRDVISIFLDDLGVHEILVASNGVKAMKMLQILDFYPALIICDLNMPEMDGIEFLRHLAKSKFSGGICILSGLNISILDSARRLADSYHMNIVGVIEKPVDKNHLAKLLIKLSAQEEYKEYSLHSLGNVEISLEELQEGITRNRIELFFQPKVHIKSNRVVSAECLARFHHPQYGLLGPDTFIPTAEKYQLIDNLTFSIMRQAAQQLSIWRKNGHLFNLSINISTLNLHRLDIPEIFEQIVYNAGISPQDLILEITESGSAEKLSTCLDILVRLCMKGFNLSIDDFGTGYANMQNLGQFPFYEMKLDRKFINEAIQNHTSLAILESCVHLGKTLNLNLVAEGVENQEEWDLVSRLGCDEIQGYFVSKALPSSDFLNWKINWEKDLNQSPYSSG